MGKIFNLNEDLCETLSLSHDIGHPPFGHAGEDVLNECMINFGGFDHNIQTIRNCTEHKIKILGNMLSITKLEFKLRNWSTIIKFSSGSIEQVA